jgi:DNA repair exonuclease SbcCD ATPase subunit
MSGPTFEPDCLPFHPPPPTKAASDALSARESALASQQSSLQAELDALLSKQEERLRAWEAHCADLEQELEQRRAQLTAEEQRWGPVGMSDSWQALLLTVAVAMVGRPEQGSSGVRGTLKKR